MAYSSSDEEPSVPRDPTTLKPLNPRRLLFEPVIGRVVDALGGYEAGTYRLGDEVGGCLKDLKKLWRKDDDDDERTVARIFYEKRVLSNDLIPILLLTAGAGQVEDKRAISCADLMSAMTWPIDMAAELADLDLAERADFTELRQSHNHYKAAILQPAVMSALFSLLLPPLAKGPKERTPRDGQVAALVLHIVRNLAAIRDSEGLQSRLVRALQETHLTDLLLTAAANADADPLLASWNTLVLEILFLLFRANVPQPALQRLLAAEARAAPAPSSRHPRFGTTITVSARATSSTVKALVHTTAPTPALLDAGKRSVRVRSAGDTEAALADDLTPEARGILRTLARALLQEGAFNALLTGLLKDMRMERAWATGNRVAVWVLGVARWVVAFFLLDGKEGEGKGKDKKLEFGQVGAAADSMFVSWVLRRLREAAEEKPKGWATMHAGMSCLTQILGLLETIITTAASNEDTDNADAEAAQTLATQLIYAGAPLDMALECLRACAATVRGPAFLDAAVQFAYAVVRMVERGGDGDKVYVRRVRKKRAKGGAAGDDDEDAAAEEKRKQEARETTFSFEAFEMKFAAAEIARALLLQLGRFRELESESLRRVVSLLHRIAVRAKAEGLFFNVSTLHLFQKILGAQKTFPRDQPHRDLVALVGFVLRRFFKALEAEPFLAVEAFFPKNRGQWKAFSSWEPPEKGVRALRAERPGAGEVQVKKGYSWSEQLGIVIAALVDAGQVELVNWTKDILATVIRQWEKIIREVEADAKVAATDGAQSDEDEDADAMATRMTQKLETPPSEVRAKMVDFLIPYLSDEEEDAATRNPHLKLLFRLAKFTLMEEDPVVSVLEWFVSADIPPADLQRTLKVIDQFLATPINLDGKKAGDLLMKTRSRTRRARSPSPDSDGDASGGGGGGGSDSDAPKKPRKQKEQKERPKPEFKSAQFIEDSDEEYGDIDAFLEKEKEMRERVALAAAATGKIATMKPTGTKKRQRKKEDGVGKRKRKRRGGDEPAPDAGSESEPDVFGSRPVDGASAKSVDAPAPRPRPRPKPRYKAKNAGAGISSPEAVPPKSPEMDGDISEPVSAGGAGRGDEDSEPMGALGRRRKNRLVISDDED
ncbi:timeless protein-domain-containing protein [Mycena sp. CBHHK59/15]|nr:timeless protein-domain-containing protein [Mycena sp. CBHHK59/15]